MTRETENTLLLLVGVATLLVTLSGAYTRYVKPSLQPWLLVCAVLLIALALVSMARDIRRGSPAPGGHRHRSATAWLLLVPVGLLTFIVPPAIGPQTSRPPAADISAAATRHPFPPLPAGRAPEITLPELLIRLAQDSAGTVENRLLSVTGFVMADGGRTDLGRVVIVCCAADAQLARIRLDGAPAAGLVDGTWVRVEGKVGAGQNASTPAEPVLQVSQVRQIEPPQNTYSY